MVAVPSRGWQVHRPRSQTKPGVIRGALRNSGWLRLSTQGRGARDEQRRRPALSVRGGASDFIPKAAGRRMCVRDVTSGPWAVA